MVERADETVALIAIHPQHAEAILAGRKSVEFRKRMFRQPVSHVLLYATAPVKGVVGWFVLDGMDEDSPTAIWRRHGERGAITRSHYRNYYRGSRSAVALKVKRPVALDEPLPLDAVVPGGRPPQSFAYVRLSGRLGDDDLRLS